MAYINFEVKLSVILMDTLIIVCSHIKGPRDLIQILSAMDIGHRVITSPYESLSQTVNFIFPKV